MELVLIVMRDIVDRFSEADSEHKKASDKKKKTTEDSSGKAEQMRKRSQETFAETLQWNENSAPKNKKQKSAFDPLEYLRKKGFIDEKFRKAEFILKKAENKERVRQQDRAFEQQQLMLQHLAGSQNRQTEQVCQINQINQQINQQQQQFAL